MPCLPPRVPHGCRGAPRHKHGFYSVPPRAARPGSLPRKRRWLENISSYCPSPGDCEPSSAGGGAGGGRGDAAC